MALALYWCSFSVSAGSVAVVKSLGAISAVRAEPGLYLKAPWPFQGVAVIDARTRVLDVMGNEVLTRDKLNVIMTVSIGWRVRPTEADIRGFFNTLQGSVENAEEKLASRVKAARKQVINKTELSSIVSADVEQAARFRALEEEMRSLVQRGVDEGGYGLELVFLEAQTLSFPADVTEKVFERMISERERESQRLLAEGETEAKIIIDRAEATRAKEEADAEAEAVRIRGQANAEVAEAYKSLEKQAELANWLRKLEVWGEALGRRGRSTLVLPNERPFDKLLEDAPRLELPSKEGQK
jgi:membrane protease subunit HflC